MKIKLNKKVLGKLTFPQFKKWLKNKRFSDMDAEKLYKSVGGKIKKDEPTS